MPDDPGPCAPAVVCVPARNEVERLPRLLDSLAGQDGIAAGARLRVVIVVNNSDDGTAERIRSGLTGWPTLRVRLVEEAYPPAAAHVGTARRRALDLAADWLADEPDGVLLSTDADARTPPHWLAANLAALAQADMVGGRLVTAFETEVAPACRALFAEIESYWEAVRAIEDRLDPPPHDPAPRHGDHTGASLSFRASRYRAVGGLPALPRGEDVAFVARMREAGARLRHCPGVFVEVSDRPVGRAEGGMAVEMARRLEAVARGEEYLLPPPGHWIAAVRRRRALRDAWARSPGDARAALAGLGVAPEEIAALDIEGCVNDIAFVERAARLLEARDAPAAPVPLRAALEAFRSTAHRAALAA